MMQYFRETVSNEGVRGLYRGMSQPLITGLPIGTLLFVGEAFAKKRLRTMGFQDEFSTSFVSGTFSALLALTIIVPFDLIKTRA